MGRVHSFMLILGHVGSGHFSCGSGWVGWRKLDPSNSVSKLKHILIECTDFRDIRKKYFVASTMKDVFEQVSMRNVINFIKETHFTTYSNICYLFIVAQ